MLFSVILNSIKIELAIINFPSIEPQRLAVKLTAVGERSLRSNHPWIFEDSIEKINKAGKSGDIAIIFSHTKNKAMGVGLYDPDSPIRIKMLYNEGGATINEEFFSERIKVLEKRFDFIQDETAKMAIEQQALIKGVSIIVEVAHKLMDQKNVPHPKGDAHDPSEKMAGIH